MHGDASQMLETLEEERKARREADAEVARLQSRVDAGSSTRSENHEAISKLKLQVRKLMAQRDRLRKQVDQGRVRVRLAACAAVRPPWPSGRSHVRCLPRGLAVCVGCRNATPNTRSTCRG